MNYNIHLQTLRPFPDLSTSFIFVSDMLYCDVPVVRGDLEHRGDFEQFGQKISDTHFFTCM